MNLNKKLVVPKSSKITYSAMLLHKSVDPKNKQISKVPTSNTWLSFWSVYSWDLFVYFQLAFIQLLNKHWLQSSKMQKKRNFIVFIKYVAYALGVGTMSPIYLKNWIWNLWLILMKFITYLETWDSHLVYESALHQFSSLSNVNTCFCSKCPLSMWL